MAAESVSLLARAKVNLCLHVTGRREDGYHLLDSLVVFPDIGDLVTARADPAISLTLGGPNAAATGAPAGNLVLRAAEAMAAAFPGRGARLHLHKVLPVAAGLGGGSADAGATIRALERLWGVALEPGRRRALALSLGADVPACLCSLPARMRGIGEDLAPAPAMPECALVLVNPGVAVPTAAVFAAFGEPGPPLGAIPERFCSPQSLAAWLALQRNDLEPAARRVAPAVGVVLAALSGLGQVLLSRMSGSGATCFGLCASEAAAEDAARVLRGLHPDWWVAVAPLRRWPGAG